MAATQAHIEELALTAYNNQEDDLGTKISDYVFLEEGNEFDQPLIDILNDPPFADDYAGFIRWLWGKVKEFAHWLWDKLFGHEED